MIKVATTVETMLDNKVELENKELMCKELELTEVLQRDVSQLSGGELQRFAIAMSCVQRADVCVENRLQLVYLPTNDLTGTCSMSPQVTWT